MESLRRKMISMIIFRKNKRKMSRESNNFQNRFVSKNSLESIQSGQNELKMQSVLSANVTLQFLMGVSLTLHFTTS